MKNPETRKKISQFQTGRKHTEEHKRKAALPKIGRRRPDHSKKLTGKKRPDQSSRMKTCQLGPDNHMFGKLNLLNQTIKEEIRNWVKRMLDTVKRTRYLNVRTVIRK